MSTLKIMIGADPELFVKKDGKYVSGFGMIEGDKENPHKVERGAVQVDGMALEFNIDPAEDEQGFITNINTVMGQLSAMVPGYELAADPVAKFGREYLATQPEKALELGCDPDFNAWMDGAANPRPDGDVDFRTGGGHVHVGWTKDMDVADPGHREAALMLTKELDYWLGLPSLFWDEDDERRAMYGKAGAYRVKHYGMEYRSLSNAWVKSEELMGIVYRNTRKAVEKLLDGNSVADLYGEHIQRAINTNDRRLANAVFEAARRRGFNPEMI